MHLAMRRFLDKAITEFDLCPLIVAKITFKWNVIVKEQDLLLVRMDKVLKKLPGFTKNIFHISRKKKVVERVCGSFDESLVLG